MKAKNLSLYAGLCAGVASVATGQTQKAVDIQSIGAQGELNPQRVAKVAMKDGEVVFQSDWMDYEPSHTRATFVQVFDCFGDGFDGPPDRAPDGGDNPDCPVGGAPQPSSRWYFGTGYCNMFYTNDMTLEPGTSSIYACDIAWYWTVAGSFTTEWCVIAIFTQDSNPDANACEPDSFDYTGWLFDFGPLPSGGYYYSNLDLPSSGTWPVPTGGSGSYAVFFYTREFQTTSGALILATCAAPMYWGTPDYTGMYPGNSHSGPVQLDDDFIIDGSHTSSECYSYVYASICPSVLGGMLQFWGDTETGGCYADCDGNGTVNTQDFLCFLNQWVAGDPAADCDGNGTINTQDFLCFLNLWNAGC